MTLKKSIFRYFVFSSSFLLFILLLILASFGVSGRNAAAAGIKMPAEEKNEEYENEYERESEEYENEYERESEEYDNGSGSGDYYEDGSGEYGYDDEYDGEYDGEYDDGEYEYYEENENKKSK